VQPTTVPLPAPRAPLTAAAIAATPTEQLLSIAVAALKGGTGKSLTAWLILCELAARGYRCLGVDADDVSQSLSDCYRLAIAAGYKVPFSVISWPSPDGFTDGVRKAVADHGANALVVDVGGGAYKVFDAAVLMCEELVVPCAPYPADLRRLPATFERAAMLASLTDINPNVLLVKTTANARDADRAREDLAALQLPNGETVALPVMDAHVPSSVMYGRLYGHVTDATGAYVDVVDELLAARQTEGFWVLPGSDRQAVRA
jgi:cellulose biosynthesis protein BcsQ